MDRGNHQMLATQEPDTRSPSAGLRHDCPICASARLSYLFVSQGYPISRCNDCQLLFRNPRPPDDVLERIYSADYFLGDGTGDNRARVSAMKRATARLYLDRLAAYAGSQSGRLLDIGCGGGELLVEAQRRGFDVAGQEISPDAVAQANAALGGSSVYCGALEDMPFQPGSFDVCVMSDVIEHFVDPLAALRIGFGLLKPNGVLMLATPSLDSWSARLMRRSWVEFKLEHLTYFSRSTIENALHRVGFRAVAIEPNKKVLTPEYVNHHFQRFRFPVVSNAMDLLYRGLPVPLKTHHVNVVASGLLAFARALERPPRQVVSIIVPAYNESKTFPTVMDTLLRKELGGLDKDIIVVESNSTDGTRELALAYERTPGVKVVLEPRPRGKGHAVRAGLAHATGDFVLIQDADLEYDFQDYEALLDPLVHHRAAFVLGIRHGGDWKMRKFTENLWQSWALNIGHVFFTSLINTLYGQKMKDPFTMFKVFRRDCVHDLIFERNGFDFDHELVIKLVRKGYTPVEIPVNYRSRSFAEGKKVDVWREPFKWIWVDFKYRLMPFARYRRTAGAVAFVADQSA